jgi:choline dehydrogenase
VIVGAGSAGCVLAHRLSAVGSVLLVEAGPDLPANPGGWLTPGTESLDWGYTTVAQPGLLGRTSPEPHGKLVGGTSSINGVVYMRPDPADLDAWPALGAKGWGYADLLPYFRRVENCVDEVDPDLGHGGPLWLERNGGRVTHPVVAAFGTAAVESGHRRLSHFDTPAGPVGTAAFRTNRVLASGARIGAKEAYLDPVRGRASLTVWSDTTATRLRFTGRRCTGVAVRRGSEIIEVSAGEVIIAASTAETPKLLTLSGIGREDELRRWGITPITVLDGVGRNLQDHVLVLSHYRARGDCAPMSGVEAAIFHRHDPSAAGPDLEMMLLPSPWLAADGRRGLIMINVLLQPRSRGEVRLGGPSAAEPPLLDPNFLADERDLAALGHGVTESQRIAGTEPLASLLDPGGPIADLGTWVRANAQTQNHMAGSCRMGIDDGAVVDPECRVHGVDQLRIVDVSIMPKLVAAHAQATVFAMAERAAELIAAGR